MLRGKSGTNAWMAMAMTARGDPNPFSLPIRIDRYLSTLACTAEKNP